MCYNKYLLCSVMRDLALWQRIASLSEEHAVSSLMDLRMKTRLLRKSRCLYTRRHGLVFQHIINLIGLSVRFVNSYMTTESSHRSHWFKWSSVPLLRHLMCTDMNPIHIFTLHLLKIYFNMIFSSAHISCKQPFTFIFSGKTFRTVFSSL
jgi:hypothetical protein